MTNTTTLSEKTPLFSNRAYDILKELVQIYLPATGTLYATLALLWGFPEPEKIVATIAALTLFLGVVMKVSNKSYNNSLSRFDGALVVDTSYTDKDVYNLEVSIPLQELREKQSVTFQVKNPA